MSQLQVELKRIISEQLLEKDWTFEYAELLLYTIQVCNLSRTTILAENVLVSCRNESTSLLINGLQHGYLHDVSTKHTETSKEKAVLSGAAGAVGVAGGIGIASGAIMSVLGAISPLAPLVLATAVGTIPLLRKIKRKIQINTKQVVLDPIEVMSYAKMLNKWLDETPLQAIAERQPPQKPETQQESDTKVWKKQFSSEVGSHKGKKAEEVKGLITKKAVEELEAGCRCHNTELANFFLKQNSKSDGTKVFELQGIIEPRYGYHFNKATIAAFKELNIPLRNEGKKGKPRGKKYCKRLGHAHCK